MNNNELSGMATFFYLTAIPTAVLVLVTFVVWLWYDLGVLPKWRRWMLAVGVLAACANVALFVGMQVYVARHDVTGVGLYSQLGDVSLPLVVLAFACALAGKGKARLPLALLAVFEVLIWVPMGIL
jgi:hypothetical protein